VTTARARRRARRRERIRAREVRYSLGQRLAIVLGFLLVVAGVVVAVGTLWATVPR
jgi:predicted anti-sigma-YlaC factor YlaD